MSLKKAKQFNPEDQKTEQTFQCQICLVQKQSNSLIYFCKSHSLCKDCFIAFLQVRVNSSIQEIKCPFQKCSQVLSSQVGLMQIVPKELKQKYNNLINSLKDIKQGKRFCPQCNTKLQQGINNYECKKCNREICKQCLSPAHQFRGKCQINVLFQLSVKFRQCSNCRFIVQKSQGCDHMTCICGYEFCYICGKSRNSYMVHNCEKNNRKYSL